ncbi:P-loop containing nucleoside triphosphate hydrolase protein [Mycena sanguinolenta]|uniref:ATP-dependent DNA helicase n=1 Tax=Mycena sanguinolenta TaxID=230812 RepID=A0A8H6XE29_9AGAR|nr:P-loop containing nucleoside triphosphate hydrolase protein [Mycena sanguinolenta]
MKLKPDLLEAKHWIYPLNQPKRDYQFNIVRHCLFDNTIVALPTGLGKTFVAGVVMLNCSLSSFVVAPLNPVVVYRWFPEGKVVFVAPTKPLVAQQIEASHKTCGIPGSDAIELTGNNAKDTRARAWKEKRVFYMTPQTFNNDLESGICDAADIILLVIGMTAVPAPYSAQIVSDEAHRATGDYAYNKVVRFMMAKNPHFRVLALTATPGSDPNAVQTLVDGLHISRIEIRDENSLDLKAYVHHKKVEQHIIAMSDDVNRIKDLLAAFMKSLLKPLQDRGIMNAWGDPTKMHPFGFQKRTESLTKDQRWAYAPLAKLSTLARAMGYLIEGTIGMCNTYMRELEADKKADDEEGGKKKTPKPNKFRDNSQFQAVIKELEQQRLRGFQAHPKMDKMNTLVIGHFAQKLGDDGQEAEQTRVMVFVSFREAVGEIVDVLNAQKPLIRASPFIGQGTDKQGKKGMAQKEQLDIIKRFKAGEFNVLVATSIGEEGLDIGEVDLIVCYDAQKTPIRMLQRLGRTGRKRDGTVHVLLAEGREELNMDKAKATYKDVQKAIVRGDQLELYGDVERLLPDHMKPQCVEKVMDIHEYVREEGRKKRSTSKERNPSKGTKRKRNDDVFRNIPDGASTGFVSVAQLLVKGTNNKRQKVARDFDEAGQDDDTEMAIESGKLLGLPRRAASAGSTSSAPTQAKSKLRRAATEGTKRKKSSPLVAPTPSQFKLKALDDEDDMDIERGTILPPIEPSGSSSRGRHSSSPTPIDIDSDSDSAPHRSPSAHRTSPDKNNMAWLLDSEDDEDRDLQIVDSSPAVKGRVSPARSDDSVCVVDEPMSFKSAGKRRAITSPEITGRQSPTYSDDSVCVVDEPMSSKSVGKRRAITPINFEPDESVEIVEPPSSKKRGTPHPDESVELVTDTSPPTKPSPPDRPSRSRRPDMPPPPLPSRFLIPRVANPSNLFDEPESPEVEMAPPSRRRLHRRKSPNKAPKPSKHRAPFPKAHYDMEAVHSGDEVSEGSSGSEDPESESDRQFLQELPETQVSPSYDQSFVYRQSLLTQPPGAGPHFGDRPMRRGMFRGGLSESSRRRPQVSSSPPRDPDDEDEYEFGSFVVGDESFLSSES